MTGASEQSFPRISVQFEVKRPDGSFLLDAGRDDFRVTEEGRDVEVVDFRAPLDDRGDSDDRGPGGRPQPEHGGGRSDRRPEAGGRLVPREAAGRVRSVAVIAFGSEVDRLCPFTTDRGQSQDGRRCTRARGGDTVLRRRRGRARDARP